MSKFYAALPLIIALAGCDATNAALAEEIARGAVNHIAFLIGKPPL